MLFKLLKETFAGSKSPNDSKLSDIVDATNADSRNSLTRKFNMGCGHNKLDDYINVDASPACHPDIVCDLENLPWPFETSSADIVLFNHSLEHMGETSKIFLGIMQELYRISKNAAKIIIHVPHPRHDNFINDPTHVRPITGPLLTLFDKEINDQWQLEKMANSPLAHYLNVNFKLTSDEGILDEPYLTLHRENKIGQDELQRLVRESNNIIIENHFELTVIKP